MSSPDQRLKKARIDAGFARAAEAAEALEITYSTYAGHENGSRGLTTEAAQRYARRFGVTANWQLFGGDPERVEPSEPAPQGSTLVPVFDVSASAGYGAINEGELVAHSLAFPPDYLRRLTTSAPGNLAIISVKGESMEPTLLDDDIVLLDASKTNLSFDGLFVLRFDDALHVKRVGRSARKGHIMIISDNKDLYPPLEIEATEVEPVGKVLWYGRKV